MAIITLQEAQTWAEGTKLTLSNLEDGLVTQVATQVLTRIALALDVTGWTTDVNTPALVRSIVAMKYVSWLYSKTYSESQDGTPDYALRLDGMAEALILGIIDGTIDLPEVPIESQFNSKPSYYPNDVSSAQEPTADDPSLGGPYMTMGTIF